MVHAAGLGFAVLNRVTPRLAGSRLCGIPPRFRQQKENTMLHALIRSLVNFLEALARGWKKVQLILLSKAGAEQRISERFAMLKQREMEAEQLDRLRNPRDYQGR